MEYAIFKDYLAERKLKFTPERRMILEQVFSHHGHFDADEIADALRARGSKASKASVYRTLPLLIDAGLVAEVFRDGARVRYEHVFGHNHHDHMLCETCGSVIEFSSPEIENLQREVCRRHGFAIKSHLLEIKGHCAACRGASRPGRTALPPG